MLNSIFKNKSLILVLAVALTMSACAKKNTSSVRKAGRATVVGNSNTSTGVTTDGDSVGNGQCASDRPGKVYSDNAANFQQQIQGLVSATLDPNAIGQVSSLLSDQRGVFMYSSFVFDSNGQLNTGSSNTTLTIYDTYAGEMYNGQLIQPYSISFSAATEGSINRAAKTFVVKFRDDLGEIVFSGTYGSGSQINGTVSYTNYSSVTGGAPAAGVLGNFTAYSCVLIGQ